MIEWGEDNHRASMREVYQQFQGRSLGSKILMGLMLVLSAACGNDNLTGPQNGAGKMFTAKIALYANSRLAYGYGNSLLVAPNEAVPSASRLPDMAYVDTSLLVRQHGDSSIRLYVQPGISITNLVRKVSLSSDGIQVTQPSDKPVVSIDSVAPLLYHLLTWGYEPSPYGGTQPYIENQSVQLGSVLPGPFQTAFVFPGGSSQMDMTMYFGYGVRCLRSGSVTIRIGEIHISIDQSAPEDFLPITLQYSCSQSDGDPSAGFDRLPPQHT